MEVVIDQDLVGRTYDDRLARLVEAGVGLWDVIRSAERSGSLDADIRRHTPNPLATFIGALPALRAVAFNGAAASVIGRKALSQDLGLALITLPSSSPAHAALSFDSKLERWRRLGSVLI
jgi:hypoxanthine-DNA glycosylase